MFEWLFKRKHIVTKRQRIAFESEMLREYLMVILISENPSELGPHSKSRKRDGYLSDEEDASRKAIRIDEQGVRVARQLYNLRQQVRALQEQVTRGDKVKHTKKVKAFYT